MNKMIPIIIGVVVFVGIGAFLYTQSQPKSPEEQMKKEVEKAMKDAGKMDKGGNSDGFDGLLSEAVKLGVPMKCSYNYEGAQVEGYLKDKKFYTKMKQDGKEMEMIWKDNCVWTWQEGGLEGMEELEAGGVKMCFEAEEGEDMWDMDSEDFNMQGGANPNMTNVSCRPAVVQDSMFNPPSNITFIDPFDMMEMGY